MTILAAVLCVGLAADAGALTYSTVAGRWCGEGITYTFTTGQLVVEFTDGTPTRYFKIVQYRYSRDMRGERVHTDFAEFSSSGRYMAQVPSNVGPRRPFHRC
jgi:hypothetical protein